MKSFGVSRMTANRALRELRDEGVLVRIAGVGSFVADRHAHAHPLEIRSIAEEIRDRGHVHRAEIVSLERIRAVRNLAEDFGIAPRSELYPLRDRAFRERSSLAAGRALRPAGSSRPTT